MSRAEICNRFGNVVPPIYMPLLEHEDQELCEERFGGWLRGVKRTTLQELVDHANPLIERSYRFQFATATVKNAAKLNKRAHNNLAALPSKKMKTGAKIESISTPARLISRTIEPSIDDIEAKLASEYEALNENVVMNEKVLEDSETQLVEAPVTDIHETSRVLQENEELRWLIDAEIANRDAALALLIVYMWRDAMDELQTLVGDPSALNEPQVHRIGHHRCAQISCEIKEEQTQSQLHQLDASLESTATESMGAVTALMSTTKTSLGELHSRRRREFVRLIHFDERLRLFVQELLSRL